MFLPPPPNPRYSDKYSPSYHFHDMMVNACKGHSCSPWPQKNAHNDEYFSVFCPGYVEWWLDSNFHSVYTKLCVSSLIWEVVNSSEWWLIHTEWWLFPTNVSRTLDFWSHGKCEWPLKEFYNERKQNNTIVYYCCSSEQGKFK